MPGLLTPVIIKTADKLLGAFPAEVRENSWAFILQVKVRGSGHYKHVDHPKVEVNTIREVVDA